jgi:hypothetical protein
VVKATPKGYLDLVMYLNNLGNVLRSRFKQTGRIEDLDEAICKAD